MSDPEQKVWLGIFTFGGAEAQRRRDVRATRKDATPKFTDAAPDAICPRCGGTQFTAKRSMAGKLGFGVLAVKSRVRCVTCGLDFKRG